MNSSHHPELLPGQAGRIDPLCDEFETAWIAGPRPRLEDFLPRAPEQDREALLHELLALELEYRSRQGERVTLEEFQQRLPGYAGVILAAFLESASSGQDWNDLASRDSSRAGEPPKPGNRYRIEALLGQGGMGAVYRAHDRKLDRLVALKIIRPDAMTPAMRARFEAEARAVAQLDHPLIVKIFDIGEIPDPNGGEVVPYLALEYVPGGSLGNRLIGALPPALGARLVALLAGAIQHAHVRGIVHRDLKPDNVLLADGGDVPALNTPLGCPRITDFGLAIRMESEPGPTTGMTMLGTPAYLAPEQAQGWPEVGAPADVYALGVILYRLLTGTRPFDADSLAELLDKIRTSSPVPVRKVRPGIPHELERICLACLDKRPENRPSAAELAEQLDPFGALEGGCRAAELVTGGYLDELAGEDEETLRESRPVRPSSRRSVLAGLLGVVVLSGAVALGVPGRWTTGPRADPGPEPATELPAAGQPIPLRVARLEVKHYANRQNDHDELTGVLGKDVYGAWLDDSVEVEVELSRPGYAYLIAYRPDGTEELIFPETVPRERRAAAVDLWTTSVQVQAATPWRQALQAARWSRANGELEPPLLSDRPRYPSISRGVNYGLNEGAGMQVFAVVASSQPLPAYRHQVARRGKAPWGSFQTPAGVVWQDDGGPVDALARNERGPGRGIAGKRELVRLTDWLRSQPEVEVVRAVAFAVQERR
jgi:serine/threonine-protein kinase